MNPINLNQNQNKVIVLSGYDNTTTNITLVEGYGAMLPDVSTPYNLIWWNSTDYLSPTDDPSAEVVKCIAKIGDTLIVMRSQQQTLASPKNIPGKLYNMALLSGSNLNTNLNTLSYYNIPQTHGISIHTGIIGDHSTNLSSVGTNTHAQIDTAITTSIGHIAASGTSVHSLGTMSTQAANNVSIAGGSITGITDLTVSGNVGIGATSPNSKLHVQNPVGVANIEIEGGLYPIQDDATVNFVRSGVYNWRIGLDSSDGNKFKILGGTFETPSFLGVTIQPGGNVGIGTMSPSTLLELNKNPGAIAELLRLNNPSGGGEGTKIEFYQDTTEVGRIANFNDGSKWNMRIGSYSNPEAVTITQYGNVGIGTTTPGYKLEVNGIIYTTGYANGNGIALGQNKLWISAPNDDNHYISMVSPGGTGYYDIYGHYFLGSNVGIGTTSPATILDVNGNIRLGASYTDNVDRFIGIGNGGTFGVDGSTAIEFKSVAVGGNYSQSIYFWCHHYGAGTGGTPRMMIRYDGNVGIGTATPATKLDINTGSNVGTTNILTLSGLDSLSVYSEYVQLTMGIADNTAGSEQGNLLIKTIQGGILKDILTYNTVAANALLLLTNGLPALTILSNGNTGIGTTSPTAKLHIGGTSGVDGIKFPDGTLQTTAAQASSGIARQMFPNPIVNNFTNESNIDDLNNTTYAEIYNTNGYLTYDLGSDKNIILNFYCFSEVYNKGTNVTNSGITVRFQISSDNTTWTDMDTVHTIVAGGVDQTIRISTPIRFIGYTRYLRFYVTYWINSYPIPGAYSKFRIMEATLFH